MRLIEVVVLMGAHCVSPVQHTPTMTEAGKVQCAVMVEKDTETGLVKVTPETAAQDSRVAAAILKLNAETAGAPEQPGTTIVPVGAPPGQSKPQATPPPATPTPDQAVASPPPAAPAEIAPSPAGTEPVKPEAPQKEKQDTLQCKGGAVPKWYKAADGHRRYRCVAP